MDADASTCQVGCAGDLSDPRTCHEPARSSRQIRLDEELRTVAVSVCPPHRWGCPVVMKLDPEHVAWICGRCGLVATSDDLGVRPG